MQVSNHDKAKTSPEICGKFPFVKVSTGQSGYSCEMLTQEICLALAEVCEQRADELDDREQAEWRLMARDWRIVANLPISPDLTSG